MRVTAIVACGFVMSWAASARAQESAAGIEYVQLPAELMQCVSNCLPPITAPANEQLAALVKRLTALEQEVAKLRGQVGLLAKKRADPTAMARLREEMAKISRRLDTLAQVNANDIVDLQQKDEALAGQLDELKGLIAGLNTRLDALEHKSGVKIGPQAGFLVLYGLDGTFYTGFPVGARLKLTLTDTVDVNFDGNALLSVSESPVGAQVRGGLTFEVHPMWAIETGIAGSWVGYNSQLEAKSAFVTADGGLTFKYSVFQATAAFLIGAEFDSGKPEFALGGALAVGVLFP